MRRVPIIDSTGLAALRDVVLRSRREGTLVVLSDLGLSTAERPMFAVTTVARETPYGERRRHPRGLADS